MKDLPPQIDLSTIDFSSFLPPPIIGLASFPFAIPTLALDRFLSEPMQESRREANRIPSRTHQNMGIKNETESLIRPILEDNWIGIFSYLDAKNLVFLMLSCKKIANLMNDDGVRERLYTARQHRLFKSQLPKSTPDFSRTMPGLDRVEREMPVLQPVLTLAPAQDRYNDNPPGQGFVMIGRAT